MMVEISELVSKVHEARERRNVATKALQRQFEPTDADFVSAQTDIMMQSYTDEQVAVAEASSHSPQAARAIDRPYNGPAMPDKGALNGSCNKSACQMPLAGNPQFIIRSTGHHYCEDCARLFNANDAENRRPFRCEPV